MIDLFLINTQPFASQDVNWSNGVVLYYCNVLSAVEDIWFRSVAESDYCVSEYWITLGADPEYQRECVVCLGQRRDSTEHHELSSLSSSYSPLLCVQRQTHTPVALICLRFPLIWTGPVWWHYPFQQNIVVTYKYVWYLPTSKVSCSCYRLYTRRSSEHLAFTTNLDRSDSKFWLNELCTMSMCNADKHTPVSTHILLCQVVALPIILVMKLTKLIGGNFLLLLSV